MRKSPRFAPRPSGGGGYNTADRSPPFPNRRRNPMARKLLLAYLGIAVGALLTPAARAQNPVTLAETFDTADPYRVELKVRLSGRLAIPQEPGKPPQVLPMTGESTLLYDERV